jgi:hypothetical protein
LAAAAAIILFLVISPNFLNTSRIESDFTYRQIKTGKGPADSKSQMTDGSKEVILLDEITGKVDGKVIEEGYNARTGMTDFLTLRIRSKNYHTFESLLKESGIDVALPETIPGTSRYVILQLYFPGRKFVTGDFNGDGQTDLAAYFKRGKNCGNWFIAYHEKEGKFTAPARTTLGDTMFFLSENDVPLSGDLNGDGFSDLVISCPPGKWKVFLNDGNANFHDPGQALLELNLPLTDEYYLLLSGDLNGDGLDDLVVHYFKGDLAGRWFVSLNAGRLNFKGFEEFPVPGQVYEAGQRYTPLILDFNGDGFGDCGIYWQQGYLNARWYLGINDKNGQFLEPCQVHFGNSPLAFQGNYSAFTGDVTADGLDDILVKSGTQDEAGEWYLEENESGIKFSFGKEVIFGEGQNFE